MQRVLHQLRCLILRLREEQDDDRHEDEYLRHNLPRLISDEDDRSPRSQAENDDMCELMFEEDELRRRLFQISEHSIHTTTVPMKRRRGNPGAHIAYQLARDYTQRAYCCGSCGTWLVRQQDVVQPEKQALDVSLDDSEVTVCVDACDVVESSEFRETNTSGIWTYDVRKVRCARCKVFLGVKVKSIERADDSRRRRSSPSNSVFDLFNEILNDARGVRLSQPEARWLRAAAAAVSAPAEPDSPVTHCVGRLIRGNGAPPQPLAALDSGGIEPGTKLVVEQTYLGIRYLRVLDGHTQRPVNAVVPLLCKGCDAILSYTDQLLCTKRRWGFGEDPPERACYVNSLLKGSFEVKGGEYEEHLAQGLMDMADVFCRCGKQVGYKFCKDKTTNGRNQNQVGRYGLVCSCFRKAPYQLGYHDPYHLSMSSDTKAF